MSTLYAICCAITGADSFVLTLEGHPLRGAIVSLGVPLWVIAWELRIGRNGADAS